MKFSLFVAGILLGGGITYFGLNSLEKPINQTSPSENKNIENWSEKYGLHENMYDIEKRLKEIATENLEKGLNFTPNIFLNQYNYPKQYDIENLEHFIADLIEDKDI